MVVVIVYTFEDSSVAFEWQPGASFNSRFFFILFFCFIRVSGLEFGQKK